MADKRIKLSNKNDNTKNVTWDTKKVNKYLYDLENGIINKDVKNPFKDGKIGFRKGKVPFKMTEYEKEEFIKCANDPIYFANEYAYAMTDDGVDNIELRDYQKDIISLFNDNRFSILLASRQIGKCCLGSTILRSYDNFDKFKISIYKLYYKALKSKRKLTFPEKAKYFLYNLIERLNNGNIKEIPG